MKVITSCVILLCLCWSCPIAIGNGPGNEETVTITHVHSIAGTVAKLECDLKVALGDDKVNLVIWYRHNNDTPIYTFDLRGHEVRGSSSGNGGGNSASHWADKKLGERAYLRVQGSTRPEEALLIIDNVRQEDEGTYRCRVDFKRSPTRNTMVNLTVTVDIRELVIVDWSGRPLKGHVSQPLPEGASANITCIAYGGKPLARVTWWKGGVLVDDTDDVSEDRQASKNVLRIPRVSRKDVLTTYSCEASNTVLQAPITSQVTIEMYLRPLDVRLEGYGGALSAGVRHEISCRTRGARPPANVTWWKDGFLIADADVKQVVSEDGNVTVSTLGIVPQVSDQGMTLSCRANNPNIPHSELRDTIMLHVLYAPQVVLSLGSNLNASNIREGVDVYFECHITANPWVHRVSWWHDGRQLHNNVSSGIIVSNQTLVMQGVSRATSGFYTCVATNAEGDTESNAFHLDVKYEPVCGNNPRSVYGAARLEEIHVDCSVDANPPATLFRWTFNHTPAGDSRDLATYKIDKKGGHSVATFTPLTERDYGSIVCSSWNDLGSQRRPCIFHIVPAGKPDPPYNCTATNRTHNSIHVACRRGFDGGLAQRFIMVVTFGDDRLVANITSTVSPDFHVAGLEPEMFYKITVYASNEKGVSRNSKTLLIKTMPRLMQEQRKISVTTTAASTPDTEMPPWIYIALGVVSSLIVTAIVLCIVLHWWYNESKYQCCNKHNNGATSPKESIKRTNSDPPISISVPSKKVTTDANASTEPLRASVDDDEDKNPDIIPHDIFYRQMYSRNSLSYTISPCQVISYNGRLEVLPLSGTATYQEATMTQPIPYRLHRENSLPLSDSVSTSRNPHPLTKWGSEIPFRELSVNVDTMLEQCTDTIRESPNKLNGVSSTMITPIVRNPTNVPKCSVETQTPLLRHKESSV